jgi:hypothetical protein
VKRLAKIKEKVLGDPNKIKAKFLESKDQSIEVTME